MLSNKQMEDLVRKKISDYYSSYGRLKIPNYMKWLQSDDYKTIKKNYIDEILNTNPNTSFQPSPIILNNDTKFDDFLNYSNKLENISSFSNPFEENKASEENISLYNPNEVTNILNEYSSIWRKWMDRRAVSRNSKKRKETISLWYKTCG